MLKRKNSGKMVLGWISPTVGTFGAVREMVEVSNVLIENDHRVIIYHPDGNPCKWLPCKAECRRLSSLQFDSLDVLIGIVDWKTELYEYLVKANAKIKAICLLGFDPAPEMAQALKKKIPTYDAAQKIILDAMGNGYTILADSNWQLEWVRKNIGYEHLGPSFGGINLEMFNAGSEGVSTGALRITYSGDPRPRKGTETVEAAIETIKQNTSVLVEFDSYWGKRFTQVQLVDFLRSTDIFLDNHRRAGWCNPVAEAIACGAVPVCSDIGANRDFAIHEETAMRVPVDNSGAMAQAALFLIDKPEVRRSMAQAGKGTIKNFSYQKIVPPLEKYFLNKL